MPFKALIEQVQRLFSSKKNGGKLVYMITDRLHYFKVVLLFICILLLIGYSQFRQHFTCDGLEIKDSSSMTDFCWINGTSTLEWKGIGRRVSHKSPHVGLSFLPGESRVPHSKVHRSLSQVRLLSHNYMRFYWALMILMVFCSYVPQRVWSGIFNDELLKALLQLPGHQESSLVKNAQEAKPYEKLVNFKSDKEADEGPKIGHMGSFQMSGSLAHLERVFQYLDSITGRENIHNHLLDYYPNQLVYMLITKENSAYKMLSLRLRRKLFLYSLYSTCFSCLQFLMPLLLFGDEYRLYGWKFGQLWWRYCILQLLRPASDISSMTYKSSAVLWPTVMNCEFKQYGYQGKLEWFGVQCTAAINDLCGKMFAVVWWLVVVSIVVELYSLFWATCYLVKPEFFLGIRFWPRARREAALVATFRFRRSKRLAQAEGYCRPEIGDEEQEDEEQGQSEGEERSSKYLSAHEEKKRLSEQLQNSHLKRGAPRCDKGTGSGHGQPRPVFWWWQRVYEYLVERSRRRRRSREVERFLNELYKDANLYHLFQLLYMRLGRDSRKVEKIIVMCSEALENYLEFWWRFAEIKARLKETLPVERAASAATAVASASAPAIDAPNGPNKGPKQLSCEPPLTGNKELLSARCLPPGATKQLTTANKIRPDTVIDVNLGSHI